MERGGGKGLSLFTHPIAASQAHPRGQGSLSTSSHRPGGEQAKFPFGLYLRPSYIKAAHQAVKRAIASVDWAMASVNAEST